MGASLSQVRWTNQEFLEFIDRKFSQLEIESNRWLNQSGRRGPHPLGKFYADIYSYYLTGHSDQDQQIIQALDQSFGNLLGKTIYIESVTERNGERSSQKLSVQVLPMEEGGEDQEEPQFKTNDSIFDKSSVIRGELRIPAHLLEQTLYEFSQKDGDSLNLNELSVVEIREGEKVLFTIQRQPDEHPIHLAAKAGDWEMVQKQLDKGTPVDLKDVNGDTPLLLALKFGHEFTARVIILHGAETRAFSDSQFDSPVHFALEKHMNLALEAMLERDPTLANYKNESRPVPLWIAIINRNEKGTQLLIHFGAETENSEGFEGSNIFMTQAVLQGILVIVQMLHQKEVPFHPDLLHMAASMGYVEILKFIFENTPELDLDQPAQGLQHHLKGKSALYAAAESGQLPSVTFLLSQGADPHFVYEGRTPIQEAIVLRTPTPLVKAFVEAGANVDVLDPLTNANLIVLGARFGNRELVELLHEKNVSIMAPNQLGQNALMLAALFGNSEYLMALIEKGAIDQGKLYEETPPPKSDKFLGLAEALLDPDDRETKKPVARKIPTLILAVERCNSQAVNALLNNGSDPNGMDSQGQTPLIVAVKGLNIQVIEMLLKANADASIPDFEGKSALDYANEMEDNDIRTRILNLLNQ